MRWSACLFVVAALASAMMAGAAQALAQTGANVTIQLPNVHTFGVNTTVIVPDSGPSPLARERQAQYSRAMYGPRPLQGAIGVNRAAGGMSVTAQIHDQRAEDEAVLRAAKSRRANWGRGNNPMRAAGGTSTAEPTLQSLARIELARAADQAAANTEARRLVERARQAHLAGQGGQAAIYYGMAARRADAALRRSIESESQKVARAPVAKP